MFSGIVQEYSKSVLKKTKPYGLSLSIKVSKKFTKGLKKGDSIAVNGVCLTVKKFIPGQIDFDVIHESLKLTNLIKLKKNDLVNVEIDIMSKYVKKFINEKK